MGITASNLSFGEVNRRFYGRKLRFTAPLTRRRKTKFPTVKPPIYLPKCQIWKQLSPNCVLLAPKPHWLPNHVGIRGKGFKPFINRYILSKQMAEVLSFVIRTYSQKIC